MEFIDKNQHLSTPSISLVLGRDLCKFEEDNRIFSKIIKEARALITNKKAKVALQVRVYDSKLIGAKDFILKIDDVREFSGVIKGKSFEKLKTQFG